MFFDLDKTILDVLMLQEGVLLVAGVAMLWTPLKSELIPKGVKHSRADQQARTPFLAQNVRLTKGHTGILIFVSQAEL